MGKWLKISTFLGIGWVFFQFYIIFYPQIPLIQRPVHIGFALALSFLAFPLAQGSLGKRLRFIDWAMSVLACLIGLYFILDSDRILNRIIYIDNVLACDYIGCVILLVLMLEGTRRTTGMPLVYVVAFFLLYAFWAPWFPGLLKGPLSGILIVSIIAILGMVAWAAMLTGYFMGPLHWLERAIFLIVSFGLIFPAFEGTWIPSIVVLTILVIWRIIKVRFPRFDFRRFIRSKETQ
jgi:TRAP-type uncharacterized transport system fused permease subunit